MRTAPRSTRIADTVLLPEATPPVSPTRIITCSPSTTVRRIASSVRRRAGDRTPRTCSPAARRACSIRASNPRPSSVRDSRVARRSSGSAVRTTQPRCSSASATSVADRGAMRRWSASTDGRMPPSSESITRSALDWAGAMSHSARAAAYSRRTSRATAISRSSVPSWVWSCGVGTVMGIAPAWVALHPHSEVTSPLFDSPREELVAWMTTPVPAAPAAAVPTPPTGGSSRTPPSP